MDTSDRDLLLRFAVAGCMIGVAVVFLSVLIGFAVRLFTLAAWG